MSEHTRLRELHAEEDRIKLKMLQADAGLIGSHDMLVTAERMDWMYHNPAQVQEKESEDFLLGKSMTLPDEREEMKKRLGVGTTAPGSLFLSSVTHQNEDTLRRLREDPLFLIRQAEHQQHKLEVARERILGPVRSTMKKEKKKSERDMGTRQQTSKRPLSSSDRDQRKRSRPDEAWRRGEQYESDGRLEERQGVPDSRFSRRSQNGNPQSEGVSPIRTLERRPRSRSLNRRPRSRSDEGFRKRQVNRINSDLSPIARGSQTDCDGQFNGDSKRSKPEENVFLESEERLQEKGPALPRGPILPREWKDKLKDVEQRQAMTAAVGEGSGDSSDDCSSSDSSLGPPQQMAGLVENRRKEREEVPLLKTRTTVSMSITETILPNLVEKEDDVFASCRQTLGEEEAERERRLEEMRREGKRHENEKNQKLDHLERIEKLKEKLEAEKRVRTAETGTAFVNTLTKEAYLSDKQTLEDRIKRYAARRRKDVSGDLLDES